VFEVMEWHFTTDGNPPNIGVEMTMRETASTVYDWTVADEVAVPDSPNTTLPNPYDLSAPTNLTLTANGTTQLIQADGTALPRILVAWTAPAEAFIQSGGVVGIEYKESTSATYLTWSRVAGDQTRDFISSDVKIGLTYDVRIFGESYFNVSTSYLTAQTGVAKDTTAPSIPTGLTAVVGTGRAVSLDWNDNTEPDFSEYGIYRKTTAVTPADANTSKIAEVRASRFVDTDVTIGTTYYYWINAYDSVENVSTFAPYVQATPSAVAASATDSTPPDTPAAFSMSLTQPGAYLSDDGTTLTRLNVSLPAMPTLGVVLNLLYKLQSGTHYLIAGQYTAGSIDAIIDDLTPGEYYTIAVQAFSAFGIGSTVRVVTGTDALAPSNTTLPTTPTDGAISSKAPAVLTWAVSSLYFGAHVSWSVNSDKDFAYFEVKSTTTNSDAAVDFIWFPANGTAGLYQTREPFFDYYRVDVQNGHVRIRAVNRSGTASAWHYAGNIASYTAVIGGNMSLQNKSNVTTTGITQGAGSLQRQVVARQPVYKQINLTGGAASETYSLDITNWGFSTAPDVGWFQSADQGGMLIRYDYDSSSSTVAELRITMADGSNVPTWTNMEITGELAEYT
jgi:hypothetical protein